MLFVQQKESLSILKMEQKINLLQQNNCNRPEMETTENRKGYDLVGVAGTDYFLGLKV